MQVKMRNTLTTILLTTFLEISWGAKRPSSALLKDLTSGGYDKLERPDSDGDPTRVVFSILIDSMIVNERNQEIIFDVYLHDYWNDTRLTWDSQKEVRESILLGVEDRGRIWHPGIYLPGTTVTLFGNQQEKLEIDRNGVVNHSKRAIIKSTCLMWYEKFPFDTQRCKMTVELFQYSADEVILESEGDTSYIMGLELDAFRLTDHRIVNCTKENTLGIYSCLEISFTIKRTIALAAKQLFIPSAIIMAFLYVSFFLGHVLLLPRALFLTVTAMLMCTHSVALKISMTLNLPNIAYFTAYEVWLAIYFAFFVLTLIEYCVVAKLCHRPDGITTEADTKHMRCGNSLDMTMRVLYPIVYLIFLIAFFANHLILDS